MFYSFEASYDTTIRKQKNILQQKIILGKLLFRQFCMKYTE